jgi:hypothetical protein
LIDLLLQRKMLESKINRYKTFLEKKNFTC